MTTQEGQHLVTGQELGDERRRLLLAGYTHESAEMQELSRRGIERDEYLWDLYAKPLIDSHQGEWAAVSLEGEVIFGRTASEVMSAATNKFGAANFVHGRMAEFRGHVLHRC